MTYTWGPSRYYVRLLRGTDLVLAMQFEDEAGAFYTTSDASTYDLDLYAMDEGGSSTPLLATSGTSTGDGSTGPLFDTAQSDGYWSGQDPRGYNFRLTLEYSASFASLDLQGGRRYLLRITLNTTSDGPRVREFVLSVEPSPTA